MKTKKQITITRAKLTGLVNLTVQKVLTIFIGAAMDEFGWTDEDLERFAVRLQRYYDAVDEHLISTDKIKKIVEQVTGTKIL